MGYQDFTTYTEVDPNSDITVTTNKIDVSSMSRNVDAYVYRDFGADYFDEIDWNFEVLHDAAAQGLSRSLSGFANNIDDANNWSDPYLAVRVNRDGSGNRYIKISTYGGGSSELAISNDTRYYCTLTRVAGADTAYLYVYTDSDRTAEHGNKFATGLSGDKFRYFYGVASWNSATSPAWTGYWQNSELNLQPSPDPVAGVLGILAPSIGLYDTRFKLRAGNRDTALTTRVRNT